MRRIALLFVAIAVSYAAGLDPALAHTTGSGWIAAVVGLYHGVVGTIPEFMGGSGYNALPDIAVAAVILCVLGREVSARARPALGAHRRPHRRQLDRSRRHPAAGVQPPDTVRPGRRSARMKLPVSP